MQCESKLVNGYYWIWRDDEWELCYKNQHGMDSITYPDWGIDNEFDETMCVPIVKPPHP